MFYNFYVNAFFARNILISQLISSRMHSILTILWITKLHLSKPKFPYAQIAFGLQKISNVRT